MSPLLPAWLISTQRPAAPYIIRFPMRRHRDHAPVSNRNRLRGGAVGPICQWFRNHAGQRPGSTRMNEESLNNSVRKFLKIVGVTSQREIEKAVRAAVASGKLKGNEKLPAKMTLSVAGIGLSLAIDGSVDLE